jgi:transposase-like protein
MIRKMTGPKALSATTLSKECGIPQPTLSSWLRSAGTVAGMKANKSKETNGTSRRTQDRSVLDRLRVVVEAAALNEEDLGAFLRREGLHREQLEQWRESAVKALGENTGRRRRGPTAEQKRIRALERELRRKDKALAEAAALLVLKKKFETVFGEEDNDTDSRNEL